MSLMGWIQKEWGIDCDRRISKFERLDSGLVWYAKASCCLVSMTLCEIDVREPMRSGTSGDFFVRHPVESLA